MRSRQAHAHYAPREAVVTKICLLLTAMQRMIMGVAGIKGQHLLQA